MKPSTQTLHNFLNMMPAVFYEYLQHPDGSSEVLYVSTSSKEILGYPSKYFIEDINHFWGIIHPDDREHIKKHDEETIDDEYATIEARIILPSGEARWIKFRSKSVSRTGKGSVVWNGFCVDITSQKETEEKLRESEKRFRDLTEMLPEAIFESDIDVNLTYANQQAFKLFGYTKQELDKGLNGIDLLVPEDRKRAKENLIKRFQGQEIGINEYNALKKDGSSFPILLHAIPVFEQGATIKGFRGVIIDITDSKQAAEELNKYRNHLEELVIDRTKELEEKTIQLEEANVALKVLLQQLDKDKKEIEESMLNNIEKLVYPYLGKLKEIISESEGNTYLDIIESNLKEITSLFSPDILGKFSKLTPAEIEVADLIRRGKTNKEIAQLLKLAPATIASHRQNIRKKLALTNKKINLRTALTTSQK